MSMLLPSRANPPEGLRWATGGGSQIGDCNGLHLAKDDGTRGSLCGRYAPATAVAFVGSRICGTCARIAKVGVVAAGDTQS